MPSPGPAQPTPEQKRLAWGLKVWQWGTGVQLFGATVFLLAQVVFLLYMAMGGASRPVVEGLLKSLFYIGQGFMVLGVLVWALKAWGAARMIRPVGQGAFNLNSIVGRGLMVVGASGVLYCSLIRAADIYQANTNGSQTITQWAWVSTVPLGALFLIGAAIFAFFIAQRAGRKTLGLILAFGLLLGLVPDLLSVLAHNITLGLGANQPRPWYLSAMQYGAGILIAPALGIEFYCLRFLRRLSGAPAPSSADEAPLSPRQRGLK